MMRHHIRTSKEMTIVSVTLCHFISELGFVVHIISITFASSVGNAISKLSHHGGVVRLRHSGWDFESFCELNCTRSELLIRIHEAQKHFLANSGRFTPFIFMYFQNLEGPEDDERALQYGHLELASPNGGVHVSAM